MISLLLADAAGLRGRRYAVSASIHDCGDEFIHEGLGRAAVVYPGYCRAIEKLSASWPWILAAFGILAVGTIVSYVVWRSVKPTDFMPSSDYVGLSVMARWPLSAFSSRCRDCSSRG